MKPLFSVVIPAYNEQEVITVCYDRLTAVMQDIGETYELVFVNDGSKDRTAEIIAGICESDDNVCLVNFSRNFGHMPAITAGLEYAKGEAIFVIDADLQDPPEVFPAMIEQWHAGFDVVYGKRRSREGEIFFKKVSAKIFYRFLRSLTSVDLPVDTGEFRLIDRKVCDAINSLQEKNRYIRGLVSWVGFKQTYIEYDRKERFAGTTKYPLKKMIVFAMDAITSFSYKPLRLATALGLVISCCSFVYLLVIVYQRLFTTTTVTGWASTIGLLLFTQGIVLMIMGLMGEYIGRIYEESKNRPIYIVQEVIRSEQIKRGVE